MTADKQEDFIEGLSTLDLVQIQRHIAGLADLPDPYKIIAADASGDGSISLADVLQLRQIVLGNQESLTNVSPWIFLDAAEQFFDESNPWPFIESININNLTNSMTDQNFIGIKVGDVNESYQTPETRSSGLVHLEIDNAKLAAGQNISVPIYASDFQNVFGLQFTLQHQGLNLVNTEAGKLNLTEENIGSFESMTSFSWNDEAPVVIGNDEVLFTLTFKATEDLSLHSAIGLSDSITKSEAYVGEDFDIYSIKLDIRDGDVAEYQLMQNTPNPFISETTIGFVLPQQGIAKLSIVDVDGKELKVIEKSFTKGYNAVTIDRNDISGNGVMFYSLEAGDFFATKKMIKL